MEYGIIRMIRAFLGVFLSAVISLFGTSFSFGGNSITVDPAVFEGGGDCYCVIWETSKKGTGYVRYTFDGEEKTIYDEIGGIIRDDDTIHRVFVPKDELRNNDYIVGSQYVGFKYAYNAIKGETVESKTIHFNGAPKEDGIDILCVSDVLGQEAALKAAVANLSFTPDLIVLNGDIAFKMEYKQDFSEIIIHDAALVSGGKIPVAFVRGDHETEGEFASRLWEYLPSTTDGLYYSFDFGALSAVVLDTADDKQDSALEHSGLTDFGAYRSRENRWIRSLKSEDFGGRYKLVFSHIPSLWDQFGYDWSTPFAALGFDAQISGHLKKACKLDSSIPAFCDGGGNAVGFTVMRVSLSDGVIRVTASNLLGKTVFSDTVDQS